MPTETYVVVLITAPSSEVAKQIARALVEQKLVACVDIVPAVNSVYLWQGQLCDDQEALLIAKTRAALFAERLVPSVKAMHPYQVPEIIALPIVMGSEDYLTWIDEVTT